MKTGQISGKPSLLLFLALVGSLALLLFLFSGHSAFNSREAPGERLEEERNILAAACRGFRNTNKNIHGGGYSILGINLQAVEELVVTAQSLSCGAKHTSALIIEKIRRLEGSGMINNCLSHGDCQAVIPALRDLENHFEQRISDISDLQTTAKQIHDLLPGDSDTNRELSEASSMRNNFYLCLQFLFSDVPNVYKILSNTGQEDSLSSSGGILSTMIMMAFRLLMIIGVFIIAPKNIWRLHLFIIKSLIIFLLFVLCVGFYNYGSFLVRSFQLSHFKHQLDLSALTGVSYSHFTKNIWSVDRFKSDNIQRKMMDKQEAPLRKLGSNYKLEIFEDSPGPAADAMELFDKYQNNLETLTEVDSEDYKDLVVAVKTILEKNLALFPSSMKTVLQCEMILNHTADRLEQADTDSRDIEETLSRLEDDLSRHKAKFQQFLKKIHKLEREVSTLEEHNSEQVRGVGTLLTVVGAFTAPLLGRNSLGSLAALGALGTFVAHSGARNRNSVLASVRERLTFFKVESKEMIDILDQVEIMSLSYSLSALSQAGADGDQFYLEETLIMLRESSQKVQMALQARRDLAEIKY